MPPTRAELELALARQYGYEDYETFRTAFSAQFGKGMLRQLETAIKRREGETAPATTGGQGPGAT